MPEGTSFFFHVTSATVARFTRRIMHSWDIPYIETNRRDFYDGHNSGTMAATGFSQIDSRSWNRVHTVTAGGDILRHHRYGTRASKLGPRAAPFSSSTMRRCADRTLLLHAGHNRKRSNDTVRCEVYTIPLLHHIPDGHKATPPPRTFTSLA